VQARGIERVPENDRTHLSIMDAGWFWFSANLQVVVSTISSRDGPL
jgi:hypothetical protein